MSEDGNAFTLRFSRRYSMAHRLTSGVAPNCGVPHGHDEVVTVEIVATGNRGLDADTNMLVEFEQVKGRWFQWIDKAVDHSFHLGDADPLVRYFRGNEPHLAKRLLITPGDPSTEMRAACFAAKLGTFLATDNPGFACRRLTIQETPTNAVEFCPGILDGILPDGDFWWDRPDQSINDFPADV